MARVVSDEARIALPEIQLLSIASPGTVELQVFRRLQAQTDHALFAAYLLAIHNARAKGADILGMSSFHIARVFQAGQAERHGQSDTLFKSSGPAFRSLSTLSSIPSAKLAASVGASDLGRSYGRGRTHGGELSFLPAG